MTMRELAKLAFVSPATVSKAFNGSSEIREETRQHIFTVAKEHGCYGKFCKNKHPKKVIALICPEVGSDFYATYIEQLRALIEEADGICLISSDRFDGDKQAELVEYYADYLKVDGIVVFELRQPLLNDCNTPVVALLQSMDPRVQAVTSTSETGMQEAVDTLVRYGHRHIAFISEPLTRGKMRLFNQHLQRHPSCTAYTAESPHRFEQAGADGVERLWWQHKHITALICAYDNIAVGAIRQLRKRGFRVPEDVSVIGMGNANADNYSETTLSSVDYQAETMCHAAWELLQQRMEHPHSPIGQDIAIPTRFVLRESVGVAAKTEV